MATNLTKVIPPSALNSLYYNAYYALESSYLLHQIYVTDLKNHNVDSSSLALNLGEGSHFKQLKKPRGTSKHVQNFLTVSYKGAYALFLGTSIMLNYQSPGTSVEKKHLLDMRVELVSIMVRLLWLLQGHGFPVPKTDTDVDKKKLKKRLEHLINVFLRDKKVRILISPFIGEEILLLKWGLNSEYIVCLSELMSKLKGLNRR